MRDIFIKQMKIFGAYFALACVGHFLFEKNAYGSIGGSTAVSAVGLAIMVQVFANILLYFDCKGEGREGYLIAALYILLLLLPGCWVVGLCK